MSEKFEMDIVFKEIFGSIIRELDKIDDYDKAFAERIGIFSGGNSNINTVPYGVPSGCYKSLLVILDGKEDIYMLIHRALKHVGVSCKGVTVFVLFYIVNDQVDWNKAWSLYKPSFDELKYKHGVQYFIYQKKQFKVDLREVKKELNNFEYINNPTDGVIDAIVLHESLMQHRSVLIFNTMFVNTKSHSYFSFKLKSDKKMIEANRLLEKVKKFILLKLKIDASIGLSEDILTELTYSRIISVESELEYCIKFCREVYPEIKRIASLVDSSRVKRL